MHKYRAQPTVVDGIRFDSKKEARRWQELNLLKKAGKVDGIILQPRFLIEVNGTPVKIRSERYPNGRKVVYVADFSYWDVDEQDRVIEDVKGMDTPVSRLKRALVEAIYGYQVRVT
jgi:hypothetical protein